MTNEYDSTGYVSSISDDMSADDDSIAEEEQILEKKFFNFFSRICTLIVASGLKT